LKGLEDIIQLIVWDISLVHDKKGWGMSGKAGFEKEPLYGFTNLRQLYEKANPNYEGRYLVPTLWDKQKGKHYFHNILFLGAELDRRDGCE